MMEIEKNPPDIDKKLWNIVRIVLYMMRKNIAKSKILMVDLQMLLKRGKIASKAKVSYYSALTCRSNDISKSFISPRDYEFSCSNTPLYPSKRRQAAQDDQLKLMHNVLGILNRYDADVMEASSPPLAPSPNNVMDNKGDTVEINNSGQVDKDAEEFINKFYKDLMKQKRLAALDSPSPLYHHLSSIH
ncbi:hypothetical protein PHJA_000816400 [Phtheirospermum japonicum]|uniref:Uncharacterized protein n=1 Tax=Phtheirospermum japonicum TaxID=374723 RepID=A0A830BIM7_9LAMI|nr:hypothetical protein PHJA_000816400 [Phtheirospermum japonicum]